MKKWVVFLLVAAFFLSGAAYAGGLHARQGPPPAKERADLVEIKQKAKVIAANNKRIRDLQAQLHRQVGEIKDLAGELKKDPARLDARKVARLRHLAGRLEQYREVLDATHGALAKRASALREVKARRDAAAFLRLQEEIISVQEHRIKVLEGLAADLAELDMELKKKAE